MNIKKILQSKMLQAASWYTLSDIFSKGIVFLTIPIFTRLLSVEEYGEVSLYLTWVSVFTILFSLNLGSSLGRGKVKYKDEYNKFSSSILSLASILFLFTFILFFIFKEQIIIITGLRSELVTLLMVSSLFGFILDFASDKLRFEYKYKINSILTLVNVSFGVFLSIYLMKNIFQDNRVMGRVIGQLIPIAVLAIFYYIYILSQGKKLINREYWSFSIAYSVPLVFHNLSHIINAQFDRIIINKYIGEAATGIYSFSYTLSMILTILIGATSKAWLPWFYENMAINNHKNIREKANLYKEIIILIYVTFMFLSPEIVKLMAPEKYWDGIKIMPYVLLGVYFQFLYGFEVDVEKYMGKTSLVALGTVLSAILNIILNIVYVPRYGYMASAYATLISYIFLFVVHFIFTKFILKSSIYGGYFYFSSSVKVVLFTIIFIFTQNNLPIRLMFLLVFLALFMRSKINLVINFRRGKK